MLRKLNCLSLKYFSVEFICNQTIVNIQALEILYQRTNLCRAQGLQHSNICIGHRHSPGLISQDSMILLVSLWVFNHPAIVNDVDREMFGKKSINFIYEIWESCLMTLTSNNICKETCSGAEISNVLNISMKFGVCISLSCTQKESFSTVCQLLYYDRQPKQTIRNLNMT